jgi:hypothetical protein
MVGIGGSDRGHKFFGGAIFEQIAYRSCLEGLLRQSFFWGTGQDKDLGRGAKLM